MPPLAPCRRGPPRVRRRSTCPTASRARRPACRRTAAGATARRTGDWRRRPGLVGGLHRSLEARDILGRHSAPATASDKIVSRETTLKSSPVMNVEKCVDRAVLHPHPFRMRAGHADQRLACGIAGRARRAICVSSPRITSGALVSRCAMPGRMRMSRASPGTRAACFRTADERRRRVDIAGLDPAGLGAGHAADENRQMSWAPRPPRDAIAARRQSRPWPPAIMPSSLRRSASTLAGAIDQPEPEAAGAPVHRDKSGFGHFKSYPWSHGQDAVSRQ